jgi:uncharacterized protein YdeI (YjbR/CyaY-like superfamily)
MNPKVDFFFEANSIWQDEFLELRKIILSCGLAEELKWGKPCYNLNKRNIVLIHGFKAYCALLFFKGALLNNSDGILIQQTNRVQAARQVRFTNKNEITKIKARLIALVFEAIEVEKAGLKIAFKKTAEFSIPDEFRIKLNGMPDLNAAFNALTPGRQRAYIFYFSAGKQPATRSLRVEKFIQKILQGKGLNE